MQNKYSFVKYFLLFALILTLITVSGTFSHTAGKIIEAIGDLIKSCGLIYGVIWLVKYIKNSYKNTVLTTLKTAAISFADFVVGILAIIQFYHAIINPLTCDYLMITAFDYALLLFYMHQHCELFGKDK